MGRDERGGARRRVSKRETKVCPLCGTLNHQRNAECLSCGWHGKFEQDKAAIDYRWQCLLDRYEEVRLEHLIARGVCVINEFGVPRRKNAWQWWAALFVRHWHDFLAQRDARCAAREAALRPKTSLPPQ